MARKKSVTFPKEVVLNKAAVQKITSLYTKTYLDILKTMTAASDFGAASSAAILADIETKLNALGFETKAWIEANVPKAYQNGSGLAIKQLEKIGAKISTGTSMTAIDARAINALMSDFSLSFGNAMSGVNRSARQVLLSASQEELKQQLAQGFVSGQTRREIAAGIKQRIMDQGLSALQDKGGRSWTLDRYADMLVRTKLAESRNTGLSTKMLENGYDLVQVTSHNSSHAACAEWEGKILSLSGNDPDYPSVDDAQAAGLFHPNCQHAINAIHPKLAAQTEAYENPYNELNAADRDAADAAFRNRNDAVTTP